MGPLPQNFVFDVPANPVRAKGGESALHWCDHECLVAIAGPAHRACSGLSVSDTCDSLSKRRRTFCALIRAEPLFLSEVRGSLAWLFRRLSATIPLGDPDEHWPAWADLMCRSPGRFRGWVKRAAALEVLRLTAHAAFQACRSFLAPYCASHAGARARDGPTCFVEACLPCRKAFVDRVSWACHASKVHGYRTRATELTKGLPQAWCSGCGKMFANVARIKRHVFVTPSCQLAWGSFLPAEGASLAPLHPSAPPAQLPGRFAASHAEDRSQEMLSVIRVSWIPFSVSMPRTIQVPGR